jgi:hypothetical protein
MSISSYMYGVILSAIKSSLYSIDKIRLASFMNYFKIHSVPISLVFIISLLFQFNYCWAEQSLPKGVMLNLDFQNIQKGLIPNKTLYPLYVPTDHLETTVVNNRNVLTFLEGQSLAIPHSSLLEPLGDAWVTSVRFFALSNGIILSQGNAEQGYVLYLKDKQLYVAIRTGHTTHILKGSIASETSNGLNRWITTEIKIKPNSIMLSIDRKRVDLVPLHYSLRGKEHKIRFGQHSILPSPFKQTHPVPPTGFTGAISSIKMLRL